MHLQIMIIYVHHQLFRKQIKHMQKRSWILIDDVQPDNPHAETQRCLFVPLKIPKMLDCP